MARGGSGTRSLVLDISADVTKLASGSKVARQAMMEMQQGAVSVEAAVRKSLENLSPVDSVRRAETEMNRMFRSIKANAQAVLGEGNPGAQLRLIDVGAADEQVRSLTAQAAGLRQVSQAFDLASKEGGEWAERQHQVSTLAMAEAQLLERQARAIDETAMAFRGAQKHMAGHDAATRQSTVVTGQKRAAMQQLSYQLNDVAVGFAAGTPPMVIFAQQSGQVVQALGLMTNSTKGLLGFIGGPWGMALTSAAMVLAPFVAKLWEGGDAATKTAEKSLSLHDALFQVSTGSEEARKAIDEYNEAQKRAGDGAGRMIQVELDLARSQLAQAQATREQLNAELELMRARSNTSAAMTPAAAQYAEAKALGEAIAKNQADLVRLDEAARNLTVNFATREAEAAVDPLKMITNRYEDMAAAAIEAARGNDALARSLQGTLTSINRQRDAALDAERLRQREARGTGLPSGSAANNVGDMTALIQQLFPGARITSTTGGRHTKGSDHYAGRAIDFVPAGGMESLSTEEVQSRLEAAGVDIRRNARGTQQIFGPGRPASKPGDHDDHFHVAWQGTVNPEKAAETARRESERLAREALQRQRSFEDDLTGAERATLQARLGSVTSDEARLALNLQLLDLDKAARARELDRAVTDGRLTETEAQTLAAEEAKTDALKKQVLLADAQTRLMDRQLEVERDAIARGIELLRRQQDEATTLDQRKAIALKILQEEMRDRRRVAQDKIDSGNADEERDGMTEMQRIGEDEGYFRRQIERDNADPIERYVERLRAATDDMDTAFEQVGASALENLEDGLVGIITGTESVAGAFKKMANQIIADLARIAVQEAILGMFGDSSGGFLKRLFGLKNGGAVGSNPTSGWGTPGLYATGGPVSGPGTGTSDSIPALLSNGEFVINAASSARFRPLLEAINDNRLPGFAAGGLVAPKAMQLARLPRLEQLSRGGTAPAERVQVDARVSVDAGPMFDARVEAVSARTVGAAAEPIMAGAEARTRRNLGRPRLPGGYTA